MPLFAQALDLIDDPALIAEYESHHQAVWPEVCTGLRGIGIRWLRIWRHQTRLFMVFEAGPTFDPKADFQTYTADPRCAAWDTLMRRYQRPLPGAPSTAWWTPMKLVCALEFPDRITSADAYPHSPGAE